PPGLRAPVRPRPLPQWPREPARQFEAGALTPPVPREAKQRRRANVTFGWLDEAGARSWHKCVIAARTGFSEPWANGPLDSFRRSKRTGPKTSVPRRLR